MKSRHNIVLQQPSSDAPLQPKIASCQCLVLLIPIMALVTLACAFLGSATPRADDIAPLPIFTSAPVPALALTLASTPQATALSFPSQTPTTISTPTPYAGGWVFFGVRDFFEQNEGGLRLYGDVLNDSSAALEVTNITGTFYDAQGQTVADGNTTGQWPVTTVPPGGRVPFELVVPGLPSADSFDLRVEAKPSSETPRQDFEFLEVTPSTEGNNYCLAGQLRNSGDALGSYLVIAAVLFDGQDKVINYADDHQAAPIDLGSGQTRDFKICVNALNQAVARYELRAWGL